MTYRGRIEHGLVVVDTPVPLPEGAAVEVVIIPSAVTSPVGKGLEALAGLAQGLPEDLAEDHDRYRRGRPT